MARALLLLVVLSVALYVQAAPPPAKYTNKYDGIDLDRILRNDRILTNYIKCLMDQGPCTSEGRELKRTLPDALETDCTKCNPNQKTAADKVIRFLIDNRRKDFDRLEKKYDPSGAYRKRFEATLQKQ
ncbi:ejaculatory bulb-specific protein 3-like [Neocloeon triangulifer]|uniref:ejaculatory bulb-specific protein 3-like n=1 Tax=Neocloeon triangulifer TaxID=2078957 RepID=UPI00286F0232|nr:ejaculatory bulb-specific protein 3-like [Neocloeon triangulifer]